MIDGRRDLVPLLIVTLGAGLVHGLLLVLVPAGRFLKYTLAARQWTAGDLPVERWLDFSPLLFHLAVLTERWGDSAAWLPGIQIVLVSLGCGLTYLLLAPEAGRRWAVVGAAVVALDRHLVIYGRLVEPEIWLLVLVLAALVLAQRGRLLPAGVALALAIGVRPTVLPLVALLPVAWWLRQTPAAGARLPRRRNVVRVLALCWAPSLLVLAGLAWRGHTATGSWAAPSMNPGTVFFEGHHPASRGVSAEYPSVVRALYDVSSEREIPDVPHVLYREVARAERPGLDAAGVNSFWAAKAEAFLADQPAVALRRTTKKLLYALHSFPWHDVPQASLYDLRLPWWLPSLPFGLLSALALVGFSVSLPRWRSWLLLYALVGSQLAVMVVFYVSARQRILLLPALVFFAVVGFRWFLDGVVDSRRRRLTAVLVAVLALALMLPTDSMRGEQFEIEAWIRLQAAQARYAQALTLPSRPGRDEAVQQAHVGLVATAGRRVDRLGDPSLLGPDVTAGAAEFLDQLLASGGRLTETQASKVGLDAAWLWLAADRPQAALASLRSPQADDRPLAAWLRARALARSEARGEALEVLDDALDRFPGHPQLLAERTVLAPQASHVQRALLGRYWSPADAWWLLARAHEAHGEYREAGAYRDRLTSHFPVLEERDAP